MKQQYQKGFSLIELVIVIVILGLLAATAIPRFLNVTEDAEDASVDGVAGGLATAVSFVRSQWEVDGRNNDNVVLDGARVYLDTRFGFPTGTSSRQATDMTVASCSEVFNTVLQNAPRNVLEGVDARGSRYAVSVNNGAGGTVIDLEGNDVAGVELCVYHLVESLTLNDSGIPTPTPTTSIGKGVTYNPGNGQVQSFIN
ncbi:type II secretion system protein [Shewanella fidelis]|uniref:Type II secretion system protein n=1 Tax=Shewanella fidelis TaxID=173509 RepID=A0AAW8NGZ6_9GAMM|nr:type II secretion system protein [Shewanella fidelis]MDR8522157.1 type II secretion system protein [Shewanella fidelis]MDW4812628.1 type II secretion system protein [Shewanella fidelis]MDW4816376.1 type II secretion system protein [Shewanella fidelis]MDW4820869.1 type II secretion system protein [Shewanella fidelis]MDW4825092.1 type II secretion system protein [Shewanella fidelis]